jgi:2-oxoglutarate dehydrogenase E2 component (dihydrolipoamide succinyltransferase)
MIPRLVAAACALLLSVPVAAQDRADQAPPPPAPAAQATPPARPAPPAKPARPAKPPVPPAAPAAPAEPGAPPVPPEPPQPAQAVNVRVDVMISEQQGGGAPTKKTVSLVVADGETGSARSDATMPVPTTTSFQSLPLNVDARPRIIDATHIRVRLVVNWRVLAAGANNGSSTQVTEQVSPILESGKPLIVAQSADPVTDRQVTLEVKATILR